MLDLIAQTKYRHSAKALQRTTVGGKGMDVLLRASVERKKVTLSVAKNRECSRKAESPVRFATKEDSCCDGRSYFSSWLWLPQFLGIATAAVGVARILFFLFLVLFLLSLVGGLMRRA